MRVLSSNASQIKQRLESAFEATAIAYGEQMQAVITEPRQWPDGFGTTRRRNGEVVVGSYRNIRDLANLQQSQDLQVSGTVARYEWDGRDVTPPVLVHDGFTHKSGKRIPGRPWPEVARQELDLTATFVNRYKAGGV